MSQMPQKMVSYLRNCENEGAEIISSPCGDATAWFIIHAGLKDYFTIVQWYEGSDEYSIVNIEGKALQRLPKVVEEVKS